MKRQNLSPVKERRALTLSDFCDFYSIGRSTAYAMIKAGKLPSVQVGGRRMIPIDGAEALIKPAGGVYAAVKDGAGMFVPGRGTAEGRLEAPLS